MTVTQDATSLKYIPQSSAEWTTLLSGSGISNPSQLYLCQEASGNITDTIGGITGSAFGSPSYQQAVTGWSKKAIKTPAGASGGWNSSSASLPLVSTTSVMVFAWVVWPGTTAGDWIWSYGSPFTSGQVILQHSSDGIEIRGNGFTNGGSHYLTGTVTKVLFQFNRAASPTLVCTTDLETISLANSCTSSSKLFYLGGDNGAATDNSAGVGFLYFAAWFGAAAEISPTLRTTLLGLMDNGPAATGGGRLAGSSPLVSSGLVNSPLVNNTRMPGPPRYYDLGGF